MSYQREASSESEKWQLTAASFETKLNTQNCQIRERYLTTMGRMIWFTESDERCKVALGGRFLSRKAGDC